MSFFRIVERVDVFMFICVLGWWDRELLVRFVCFLSSFLCFFGFFFYLRRDYMSLSSIGIVLTVEVGLNDGMDSISVFIIHPLWNTEHGSSETGY